MNTEQSKFVPNSDVTASVESIETVYEAPAIESVLTPESLEREVHYAGNNVAISGLETNTAAP